MDYNKFNVLSQKVMRNSSTEEDEKELVAILQKRILEKKEERETNKEYKIAAKTVANAVNNFITAIKTSFNIYIGDEENVGYTVMNRIEKAEYDENCNTLYLYGKHD